MYRYRGYRCTDLAVIESSSISSNRIVGKQEVVKYDEWLCAVKENLIWRGVEDPARSKSHEPIPLRMT
jgi:hypothetical protein